MTILPEHAAEPEPLAPLSYGAVLAGVLAAYGTFVLVISIVGGFANGAHANQQFSGATWRQLGTGGGIVTGVALFWSWVVGGFIAGRLAGRDALRHGIWTFIVGIVLFTVVATAVTWFPDTAADIRNLRILGLPVRRREWGDVLGVAGISSLVGMLAGALVGSRWGVGSAVAAVAPAVAPAVAVEAAPAYVEPEPEAQVDEPQLFAPEAEPEPSLLAAWAAPVIEHEEAEAGGPEPEPATLQEAWAPIERIPQPESPPRESPEAPEPEPVASPWWTPASAEAEPAQAEVVSGEPLSQEPPPPAPPSWWPAPGGEEPSVGAEPAPTPDEGWALPEVETPYAGEGQPPSPPAEEEYNWPAEATGFDAPPAPAGPASDYQEAPEALPDRDEQAEREAEDERRRRQDEAARAYRQALEEQ